MKKSILVLICVIGICGAAFVIPTRSAQAYCEPECLLNIGGQLMLDLKAKFQSMLTGLQQKALSYFTEGNEDLTDKLKKGSGGNATQARDISYLPQTQSKGKSTGLNSKVAYTRATSAKSDSAGAQGSGSSSTTTKADPAVHVAAFQGSSGPSAGEEEISKRATEIQSALLNQEGTLDGMSTERSKQTAIAEEEAIQNFAKALVLKEQLSHLSKINDRLQQIRDGIAPANPLMNTTPVEAPQTHSGVATPRVSLQGGRPLDVAWKDNLEVRLIWDALLTMQQQMAVVQIKTQVDNARISMGEIGEMEDIVVVEDEELPSPTEDPENLIK